MTNRKIEYWVIPPKADAEFVAHMEEVLETYEKPYDPACPVLCMDEQPVQLVKETRTPILRCYHIFTWPWVSRWHFFDGKV